MGLREMIYGLPSYTRSVSEGEKLRYYADLGRVGFESGITLQDLLNGLVGELEHGNSLDYHFCGR